MIHVIANIEVRRGMAEAYIEEFRKLVPKVLAEDGCIEYGPAVDVETDIGAQVPFRQDVVTIVEKWASIEALNAHLKAPPLAEFRETVKDIALGVTLQILEPA